jgi:GntR family transcriptional regulator
MADPIYRKIADDLRQQIESGELAPGAQLPTELELREHYDNASRNTVRDAIKWLISRGLVVTQPGRGTFVLQKIKPFVAPLSPDESGVSHVEGSGFMHAVKQQGGEPYVTDPRVEVQNARAEVARELRIDEGSTVVSRHQERFIDGSPSSLQTSFYPMEFVQRGAVDLLLAANIQQGGATGYIEEKLGIQQAGYRDRLTVRQPNAGEVAFFKVPDTGSMLVVVTHRTAYARGGQPMRYTITVYASDRNHFVIDYGEVPPLDDLVRDL